VVDLIRGKTVEEAQTILKFITKRAAQPLLKLLKSAIANAKNNFQLNEENLYISKITVDEGPKYKRRMPRARGQATEIQKKTSHITMVLDEVLKRKKLKELRKIKKTEEGDKIEKVLKERVLKSEKPKFRPKKEIRGPKIEKGIKRIFRRKAF